VGGLELTRLANSHVVTTIHIAMHVVIDDYPMYINTCVITRARTTLV